MCSHHDRNGFSPHKKGSCSITQLLSRPKVSKSHSVISQEPFLYSVRTLSSQPATAQSVALKSFGEKPHLQGSGWSSGCTGDTSDWKGVCTGQAKIDSDRQTLLCKIYCLCKLICFWTIVFHVQLYGIHSFLLFQILIK